MKNTAFAVSVAGFGGSPLTTTRNSSILRDRPQGVVVDGDRVERMIRWLREKMIRWLRENEARITRPRKGKVSFDFAGPSLTARIEDVQEKI